MPDGDEADEGYVVIREALKQTRKVAIGQLIMGGPRPLSWHQGAWQRLIASILRYANELRAHEPYFEGLTAEAKTDAVALAAELIEDQSSKFEPESVPDQFAAAMREYLRAKVEQRAPEVMIARKKASLLPTRQRRPLLTRCCR
jgi:DNA end-binding protein Ku